VLRRDDLFDTRLRIIDNTARFDGREVGRDELLVFNTSLRANKEIDFNGEGVEYETQYRIDDDEFGVVLWKRRDPILDDNPVGGGIATPLGEGVVSLLLEAYDGDNWVPQWDSDEFGIPEAIRITIAATGMLDGDDLYPPFVLLRTVVALDRIMQPADLYEVVEEDDETQGSDGVLDPDSEAGENAGDSGESDGGAGSTGGRDDSTGSTSSGGKGTTTFTDPDGNVYEIPNP
jgi:hypothetical protein